jgi:hypothetical protein
MIIKYRSVLGGHRKPNGSACDTLRTFPFLIFERLETRLQIAEPFSKKERSTILYEKTAVWKKGLCYRKRKLYLSSEFLLKIVCEVSVNQTIIPKIILLTFLNFRVERSF